MQSDSRIYMCWCGVWMHCQPQEFRRASRFRTYVRRGIPFFRLYDAHLTSNKPLCILHFQENRAHTKKCGSLTLEAPSEKNSKQRIRLAIGFPGCDSSHGLGVRKSRCKSSALKHPQEHFSLSREKERLLRGAIQGRRLFCVRAHFGGALPHVMYTGELITLTAVPGNGQLVCTHTHYRRAKLLVRKSKCKKR